MAFSNEITYDYLNNIGKFPVLTQAEEIALFKKYIDNNDLMAKEELINCNLKLVVSVAKPLLNASNMELNDLIQEGSLGLIKAVEKFELIHNTKFSTYAVYWIKQSIIKAINDKSRSVRIPSYLQAVRKQIVDAEIKYVETYDEMPSEAKLCEVTGLPLSKIREVKSYFKDTVSLELSQDEESGTIGDYLKDESSIDDSFFKNELKSEITKILDTLPEREKMVVMYRYGLNGEKPLTLEDISVMIGGVTRERVRQIEKRAFERINNKVNREKLKDYLE